MGDASLPLLISRDYVVVPNRRPCCDINMLREIEIRRVFVRDREAPRFEILCNGYQALIITSNKRQTRQQSQMTCNASRPSRIAQPAFLEHELEYAPAFRRIDMANLAHILLLELAFLFHGLAEDVLFDRLVRLGLQTQLGA